MPRFYEPGFSRGVQMKSVVHKYPLTEAVTELELPGLSQILCVQMQGEVPTLWVEKPIIHPLADEYPAFEKSKIHVIMTGEEFEFINYTTMHYIGTVQHESGIVGHVYQETAE